MFLNCLCKLIPGDCGNVLTTGLLFKNWQSEWESAEYKLNMYYIGKFSCQGGGGKDTNCSGSFSSISIVCALFQILCLVATILHATCTLKGVKEENILKPI